MDTALPQLEGLRPEEPVGRLGKYTLLKALAKGGMAQVFLAQRDGAEEICVLKQLLGEIAEHETAVKRFHREAKLASYLNHRNIARVLDAGFEDKTFCIAMEYVLGKDLEAMSHHMLRQGRLLPYPVSLASILGALEGLAYAHAAKDPSGRPLQLVHRDLSPRNVMLSVEGVPKVIDFGVARSDSGDFRTAPGMLVGTIRYVSPEQAVAEDVDARSDIYSLSVVLHELLTGEYSVPAGEPMKVLKYVVSETPPPVHVLNPDLPPALSEVINRGLAKERDDRWPDAATYRQALIEAAGPLAHASELNLGTFVRSFFQGDVELGEALISFGRERFVRQVVSTSDEQAKALSEKTRTGYVPALQSSPDEPPHVGTVVPVDLTSPGAPMPSLAGAPVRPKGATNLMVRDRTPSLSRTILFPEDQAQRLIETDEISGITNVELVTSEMGVAAPPPTSSTSRIVLTVTVALASMLIGAVLMSVLQNQNRNTVTRAAPGIDPTPRPLVTRPANPKTTVAPEPEPVEPPAPPPSPALVAPPKPKSKKVPSRLPPAVPMAAPLDTPPPAPPPVPKETAKVSERRWEQVDREIDGLIDQLAVASKESQPELRGKLASAFRNAYKGLPPETVKHLTGKLTSLSLGGSENGYRKLAHEMRARRTAGAAP